MIAALVVALVLALVGLAIATRSRVRVARLLAHERADRQRIALAARVELPRALSAEVAALLAPLRASLIALDDRADAQTVALVDLRGTLGALRDVVIDLREITRELGDLTAELRGVGASLSEPRTVHRPRRAAPSVAPPGSATTLPPEPAQVAAGLGPRPTSRPLPPRSTPHPPPVRVARPASPSAGAGHGPRAATLLGVGVAPPASEPAHGDPWSHVDRPSDRPSDADGERTRVGPRVSPDALGPSPRRPLGTSPTLPSMQAIAVTTGQGPRSPS
jgi:hypothetical protein